MDYLLHVLVFVALYVVLAVSLDLLVGHTGLLSMSHAAFYAIGAYASALMTVRAGAPFLVGLLVGMAVAAGISLLVSWPSSRLYDDYFVIASFAFQMIVFGVLNNWIEVTRGPLGISGIPPPGLFGWTLQSRLGVLLLAAVLAVCAWAIAGRVAASPFGRVLRALREDDVFAKALGKNTSQFKVLVFAVSAALAASAGSLYAHYVTYIDPTNFTVMESILVVSIVIIGGPASRWGPVLGAAVLVTLPELLRFVGLPDFVAANARQILYGALLVALVVWRPQGFLGEYTFEKGGSRA